MALIDLSQVNPLEPHSLTLSHQEAGMRHSHSNLSEL